MSSGFALRNPDSHLIFRPTFSDVNAGFRVASVAQANNEFSTWSANFPYPELSDPATGKLTITLRVPALTGLSYALWISSDLENWGK